MSVRECEGVAGQVKIGLYRLQSQQQTVQPCQESRRLVEFMEKSKIRSEFQTTIGKGTSDLENDETIANEHDEYGDNLMCSKSQFSEEFAADAQAGLCDLLFRTLST